MPPNPSCSVYIGNLDEKVNERVLYEVLVQAGRIVDLHIPRDRETNFPKGYAFVEYETEEIADYAVRLFSGLVSLNNKMLKFAISRQVKPSHSLATNGAPASNSPSKPRSDSAIAKNPENSVHEAQPLPCRFAERIHSASNYPEASSPGHGTNKNRSDFNNDFGYSKRVFRATLDGV